MKILKYGTLPTLESEKLYKATCDYCKTIIEFQYKEAIYGFDECHGRYLDIGCPLCNRSIRKNINHL
jgi:hypothetical protein